MQIIVFHSKSGPLFVKYLTAKQSALITYFLQPCLRMYIVVSLSLIPLLVFICAVLLLRLELTCWCDYHQYWIKITNTASTTAIFIHGSGSHQVCTVIKDQHTTSSNSRDHDERLQHHAAASCWNERPTLLLSSTLRRQYTVEISHFTDRWILFSQWIFIRWPDGAHAPR